MASRCDELTLVCITQVRYMIRTVADGSVSSRPAEGPLDFSSRLEAVLDPAYRLATVMLRDPSGAEDAVQEAAVKAWRKHGQLRGGAESFRPWFLSIVANECRMARRSRWLGVIRMADPPQPVVSPEDATQVGRDLREAIMALEVADRAALFCFFYLDMPLDEVARVLGISPSAARSRVYRAARRLRPGLDAGEMMQ
jgi:RNA polymerase sigma-70 factor (ECF subfamily)